MRFAGKLFYFLLAAAPAYAGPVEPVQSSAVVGTAHKVLDLIIETVVKYSFQVLAGIIILIAGWVLAQFACRFVQEFLKKKRLDVTVTKFLIYGVRLVIMIFAGLIALGKFGIEIAPFIAGLSVIGLGTSLAMQGVMSNYASGITLIFTKPFKVGDIIEVVGQMGEVEDMTLPRTILKTVDGTTIIIPNKHIIGEIIHNFSDSKKLDIKIGVDYKADLDKAVAAIRAVIDREPRICRKPEPKMGVAEFGDSSVNLYARLWCKQSDYWDVMFAVNKNIFAEFKKVGIEIPFPRRDVYLHQERS